MKNAKTLLRKIFFIAAVITAMTVTGCKQPVKKDKGGEVKTFAVTVTPPTNGTISVKKGGELLNGAALKAVAENSEIEITLTANSGYKAVKLVINGKPETNSAGSKTITKKVTVTKALSIRGETAEESSEKDGFVEIVPPSGGIAGMNPDYPTPSGSKGVFRTGKTVKISPYKIAKYEVTYKLWKEVYDWAVSNGYTFANTGQKGGADNYDENIHTELEPVTKISWRDAIVWCNAYTQMKNDGSDTECVYRKSYTDFSVLKNASAKSGNVFECDKAYYDKTKKGFRLPTEAEWEFAARFQVDNASKNAVKHGDVWLTRADYASGAAKQTCFEEFILPANETWENLRDATAAVAVFGEWWNGTTLISQEPKVQKTAVAGSKAANSLGLYDMSGNVWEYCWDRHGKIKIEDETDPSGPDVGGIRVSRSGSWVQDAGYCAVGLRFFNEPSDATMELGFRLASGASVFSVPEKFTVTFGVEGQGGTLEASVDGKTDKSGSIEVESGKTVTFKAKPETGYKVKSWAGLTSAPNPPDSETVTLKITKAENVKVSFAEESSEKDGFVEIAPPSGGIAGAEPSYSIPEDKDWGKGVFRKDRTVELSPYSIGKYEVTYKLWKEVYDWAKSNGYTFAAAGQKGGGEDFSYNEAQHTDDEPVTKVSWRDCIVWCNAYTHMKNNSEAECVYLKEKAGGEPLKNAEERVTITTEDDTVELNACDLAYADRSKKGFRLPTEAEWEFAARYQGGDGDSLDKTNAEKYGSIYLTKLDSASGAKLPVPAQNVTVPSGKTYEDLKNELDRVAVFGKYWDGSKFVVHNTAKTTMAAGKKAPNELGLYDMTGNVWEWCFDWDAAIEKGSVKDPQGPDIYSINRFNRVVRGGHWDNLPQICTVGRRIDSMPESALGYLGFRLAKGASVFPAPEQFTVTFQQPENGSLSAVIKGTATTVESGSKHPKGTEIRFTASPASGYRVKDWTPADEIKLVSTDTKTVGDLVLEKNTTVTVVFEPLPKFKVTFSLDGTGGTGTITARKGTAPNQAEIQSGDFVTAGERIEFEVTGYDEATYQPVWTVTGLKTKPLVIKKKAKIFFPGTYTSKATEVDVKLKLIESKIEKFTVTFGVEGQGGTIEASVDGKTDKSGSIEVESGKTVTFKAKPETGYKVKNWAGLTSAPNPPDSETVELKITKAENVKVEFKEKTPSAPPEDGKVSVTFVVNGEADAGDIFVGINGKNTTISAGTAKTLKIEKGTNIGISVFANTGFEFSCPQIKPGKTSGVIKNVQQDMTVTVTFTKKT